MGLLTSLAKASLPNCERSLSNRPGTSWVVRLGDRLSGKTHNYLIVGCEAEIQNVFLVFTAL